MCSGVLAEKNAFAGGKIAFSINLSNQTLADTETMNAIADVIRTSGVPPKALVFEITETSEMTSMHLVRKHMNLLRGLGMPVCAGRLRHRLLVVHASAPFAGRLREDRRQFRRRHGRQRSRSHHGGKYRESGEVDETRRDW
ncbi:MAG: EAL domain-containing protein [Ahniella sp.]|nr:EAL domain-containing protein [Ahniella sp.]